MDSEYGLIVKSSELDILDKHGIEYYPHDLMEFLNDETHNQGDREVEIDFEIKSELDKAMIVLGRK